MTPAQIIGVFAVLILPPLVALVRDREAQREANEVTDAWLRGSDAARKKDA